MDLVGIAAVLGVPVTALALIARLVSEYSLPRQLARLIELSEAMKDNDVARADLLDVQAVLAFRIRLNVSSREPIVLWIVSYAFAAVGYGLLVLGQLNGPRKINLLELLASPSRDLLGIQQLYLWGLACTVIGFVGLVLALIRSLRNAGARKKATAKRVADLRLERELRQKVRAKEKELAALRARKRVGWRRRRSQP